MSETAAKKVGDVKAYSRVDTTMKVFSYRPPTEAPKERAFIPLVRSDTMVALVQIIKEGGEQELHSHGAMDGFWFVLKGKARFYGDGDEVLGTLGPHEGIFIPKNFLYWFEAIGDEPLELLQVESKDKTVPNTYFTPHKKDMGVASVYSPEGELLGTGLSIATDPPKG